MDKKTCNDCKYFRHHYSFDQQRIFRVYCGHCTCPKAKKEPMFRSVLIRMFTNFGRGIVSSADVCYNEANRKPPSEREVARVA